MGIRARHAALTFAVLACASWVGAWPPGVGAADRASPHWSYDGETGPEHWDELSPDFAACGLGQQQTPIDLSSAAKGGTESIRFDYRPLEWRVVNNGHTIEVDVGPGATITADGERYDLVQFHFHHPSEHLIDGAAFDMEIHFVHKAPSGRLAVVGVLVRSGAHNPRLDPILDRMPQGEGEKIAMAGRMNPAALLPARQSFFHYMGSLTTPPCSEGLAWSVFRDPVEASPEQIRRFAALYPHNARPLQRRNDRLLVETGAR